MNAPKVEEAEMYPQVTQFETRDQLGREWLELRELRRAAKAPRQQRRTLVPAVLHALTRRGQSTRQVSA